ncbi:MAG: response regulator [Rhodospirillales bacterium]
MTEYDFQDLSVLVCDDSLQIRALVKTCLMAFGVKTILDAANAEAAFEQLIDKKPDLVITDWALGESDGLDLVRRVRNDMDSPNPYVPIIMLTGYTEMDRVEIARDAGVSTFLAKPMSADSLLKRMIALVEDERPFIRAMNFFGPDRRFHAAEDFGGADRRGDAAA